MALSDRSHPKGIDIRENGERVPIQLDRLTLALVSLDADLLPHAIACVEKLWRDLYPNDLVRGPVAQLKAISARLDVSRAHVVKTALARYGKDKV